MEPREIKDKKGPEWYIQQRIIKFLEDRGWHVMPTHGNLYQVGFPDLYCVHPEFKLQRWVEVKNPKSYSFTKAQLENFPKISDAGVGIWIMVEATEHEYRKMVKGRPNWVWYLK